MTDEMGFALRKARGFVSWNVRRDELRKQLSFIIQWLPRVVFSGLRKPGHNSLRSVQPEMPPQLTRKPSPLLSKKYTKFFETVVTANGVKLFDMLTKIFKDSQKDLLLKL